MFLLEDLRYCGRMLRRAPVTVLISVLSLGLGIGATTSVFSFVNAVQFAPLPVANEGTLVDLSETSVTELCHDCSVGTSYPTFLEWRAAASSFASMDGYTEERFVVSGGVGPERVGGARISAGLFDTLGVRPALGRGLSPDDERPTATPVVVISDMLWRRRLGGHSAVLGSMLKIGGLDRIVIGVMGERFAFPEYAQFWLPLAPATGNWARDQRSLGVVARLKSGVSIETARVEMATIGAAQVQSHPEQRNWSPVVASLRDDLTGETAMASVVLLSAVAFVLLIACANVANLLLVRASDRRREIAIRTALGAGAWRIARLVLAESVALSVAGGFVGLLLTVRAADGLVAALGAEAPFWITFRIDGRVLAFGVVLTTVTGVLCGLVPAFQATRPDVQVTLRDGGTAVGAAKGQRLRSVLAAGQLALALVLLAGAGLMIKTTIRTFRFNAGYDASRVLVGDVSLAGARYDDPAQIATFATGVIERLERMPGVRAAVDRTVFFRGFGATGQRVSIEGRSDISEDASPSFYHAVTSGYFPALGLPIRYGRDFAAIDRDVVIVNAEMARRLWGAASPLGARLRFGSDAASRWLTVVGVAGAHGGGPLGRGEAPTAYVPFAVTSGRDFAITVGSRADPRPLVAEIRAAVAALDPDQPVEDVMTMEEAYARWAAPARFVALLMGSLAAIALVMASMGTFGIVAFAVSRRTREIGVRLALGATPRQVQQQMASAGLRLVIGGLLVGLPGAWLSTRALEGILAGTSPTDPVVFALVSIVLAAVTFLASWIPARQAALVDPVVALRRE
jgi:predicted permease